MKKVRQILTEMRACCPDRSAAMSAWNKSSATFEMVSGTVVARVPYDGACLFSSIAYFATKDDERVQHVK